jgi:ribonuclease HI
MNNFDLKIYTDGGARGNPGPAACAFVVEKNNKTLFKKSKFLGVTTNNVAEYSAVIEALEWMEAKKLFSKKTAFFLDSQLVVRQLKGIYKIKKEHLKNCYLKIKKLEEKFSSIEYFYVPREQNFFADELLNQELDKNI